MPKIIKATFSLVAVCYLTGCYTVGEQTSKTIDILAENALPSASWYTKTFIVEATKLSLDPHYYNRMGKALVK